MNLPHYNDLFTQTFQKLGYHVVYQPSCLQPPYDRQCWPLKYPIVNWTNDTLVVMHCQDWVTALDNYSPELQAIEEHFKDRANQVVVVHWNIDLNKIYKGPLRLLYFATHSYELIQKIRNLSSDWAPYQSNQRKKNWQCLNGMIKPHREKVAKHLQTIHSKGILSLGSEIVLQHSDYKNYQANNNDLNWIQLQFVYNQCAINIVTESQYDDDPGIISEKTLMCFLAKQIPILIGHKHIIEQCERLGFDMFRDIVNTSYDCESNSTRWRSALEYNQHLFTSTIDLDLLDDRLRHNQQLVLEFPEYQIKQFNDKVQANFVNLYTS